MDCISASEKLDTGIVFDTVTCRLRNACFKRFLLFSFSIGNCDKVSSKILLLNVFCVRMVQAFS